MILIDDNSTMTDDCAVCLGNFDGIHIGHQKILETLKSNAAEGGSKTVMLTFKIHPENYLNSRTITKLITGEKLKFDILDRYGIDILYLHEFDEATKNLSPDEFIKSILIDKLNSRILVAGFNYRFAKNRQGDSAALKKLGEKYGLKVIIVPAVYDDEDIVSSTLVRKRLDEGRIREVNRLLGRRYMVLGKVSHGKKRGRELGFPTANIIPEPEIIYPKKGVYLTKTSYDGHTFMPSVTNIGSNPTVGGIDTIIETHVIGQAAELYDFEIRVEFYDKIRDEKVFDSVNRLREQIGADIKIASEYFGLED